MSERGGFIDQETVILDGVSHPVELIGDEPTEQGFGYAVKTYRFKEDETKDVAEIIIHSNAYIPPELIQRGPITDYPIRGSGTFIILWPDGRLEKMEFDEKNPNQGNPKITYSDGSYIAWRAGAEGLGIIEVCSPPVKNPEVEFKVLDIESSEMPEEFRAAYKDLVSPRV